jgi:hypothetical protein
MPRFGTRHRIDLAMQEIVLFRLLGFPGEVLIAGHPGFQRTLAHLKLLGARPLREAGGIRPDRPIIALPLAGTNCSGNLQRQSTPYVLALS